MLRVLKMTQLLKLLQGGFDRSEFNTDASTWPPKVNKTIRNIGSFCIANLNSCRGVL